MIARPADYVKVTSKVEQENVAVVVRTGESVFVDVKSRPDSSMGKTSSMFISATMLAVSGVRIYIEAVVFSNSTGAARGATRRFNNCLARNRLTSSKLWGNP